MKTIRRSQTSKRSEKESPRICWSFPFLAYTAEEALLSLALAALLAAFCVGSWAAATPVCGAAVAGCLAASAFAVVRTAKERCQAAMKEQVPEALRAMGVCFGAGLSLMQTFQQVAREMRDPMRSVFARAARTMEAGRGASEALAAIREGASIPEMSFVAVALDVQHQAGGSMARVLDAAREAVEGELELARSLRVQTAQAKLSARIVSVMPLALVALFSLMSEGFLTPFFSSAEGFALLIIALAMQVAGVLAVRRTLRVETGS